MFLNNKFIRVYFDFLKLEHIAKLKFMKFIKTNYID